MITITDPSAMQWHTFPLPTANLCTSGGTIIVLNWETGTKLTTTLIHARGEDWFEIGKDGPGDTCFCIQTTTGEHWWAWHERFSEELKDKEITQ